MGPAPPFHVFFHLGVFPFTHARGLAQLLRLGNQTLFLPYLSFLSSFFFFLFAFFSSSKGKAWDPKSSRTLVIITFFSPFFSVLAQVSFFFPPPV